MAANATSEKVNASAGGAVIAIAELAVVTAAEVAAAVVVVAEV